MKTAALFPRWNALCATVAAPHAVMAVWFDHVVTAWDSPGRFYHTLDHLSAVLDCLDDPRDMRDPVALRLAAWFHDAIYDPPANDNEERSAELAALCAVEMGLSRQRTSEVMRLILLTKTHRTDVADVDGQLLLDADLAILGAERNAYDSYADAIRREYAWVPDALYRQGRARVLQSFLARSRLYHRVERLEAAARDNLRRELGQLGVSA